MRAYEFRRYLLRRKISETDIKKHIENVRRIEKALDKTAESFSSIGTVESQLKWHVFPWKKKELISSLELYFAFMSAYRKPLFQREIISFKECSECGSKTPLGSTYCRNCGALIGKTQFKQINQVYDSVVDKWNNHRNAMIGGIAAVVVLFLFIIVQTVTAFPLPDVVGENPGTASRILVDHGTNETSILYQCDGTDLNEADLADGEYEIVSQDPIAGKKVHKSTRVTLECKDLYQERSEAIRASRYCEASEAESVAKKYDYSYQEKILDENLPDNEILYVLRITDQNDDERSVVYELDSKDNIIAWIKGETEKLIGKPAIEGESLEDQTGCTVGYVNYDKNEVFSYDSDIDDYLITGLSEFDINEKYISIAVDTEWHLEELELIAGLKDKIPYEGMLEGYIDETGAGKHTDELYGEVDDSKDYIWKSPDEKYTVLTVTCEDGVVVSVKKESEEAFWQGDLPDYSVDADAIYEKIEKAEAEKEAKLEAEAEKYAAAARDNMAVFTTRSGTYHISGCGDLNRAKWSGEITYGYAKSHGYHACLHCNPDTYCERSYDDYKAEYIRKEGKM